jgi:hypothetical protein
MVLTGSPVNAASRPIESASATKPLASPVTGGSTLASVIGQAAGAHRHGIPQAGRRHRQDPAPGQASPGKVGQSFGTYGLNIVAFIVAYNRARLREIARTKLPDLNTDDLEAAERIVAGTARSMGIELVDAK